MNLILSFLIEVTLTLAASALIVRYLYPYLKKILVDLCGTEDRAQFWAAFSNILLLGVPVIFALGYRPQTGIAEELFFEVLRRLGENLAGMLFAVITVGLVVAFFALVAPRSLKAEPK